jgi:hypothetical protein
MDTSNTTIAPILLMIIEFATNSMNLVIVLIIIQTGFLIIMIIYVIYREYSINGVACLKKIKADKEKAGLFE